MSAHANSWQEGPVTFEDLLCSLSEPLQKYMLPCLCLNAKALLRATCRAALQLVDDHDDALWRPLANRVVAAGLIDSSKSSQNVQRFLKHQLNPPVHTGKTVWLIIAEGRYCRHDISQLRDC